MGTIKSPILPRDTSHVSNQNIEIRKSTGISVGHTLFKQQQQQQQQQQNNRGHRTRFNLALTITGTWD
jgi:hypothetical protein